MKYHNRSSQFVLPNRELLPDPIFLEPDDNKEKRTAVHEFFKKPAFAKLVSETMRSKNAKGEMISAASSIRISYLPPVSSLVFYSPLSLTLQNGSAAQHSSALASFLDPLQD